MLHRIVMDKGTLKKEVIANWRSDEKIERLLNEAWGRLKR